MIQDNLKLRVARIKAQRKQYAPILYAWSIVVKERRIALRLKEI